MKEIYTDKCLGRLLSFKYKETVLVPCIPTRELQPWMGEIGLLFPNALNRFYLTVDANWLDVGKPFMVHEPSCHILFLPLIGRRKNVNMGKIRATVKEGWEICNEVNCRSFLLKRGNVPFDIELMESWLRYPGVIFYYV